MQTLPSAQQMRRAWQRRDAAYDGLFFLAVRTTGIYCRPTCPARKPLPRNVTYFATPAAAEAAGFRACKRCRPATADARPEWARRLLADLERAPETPLRGADLRARGVDPSTARRWFQRHLGMSFAAYARTRRVGGAHAALRTGARLDEAVGAAGFASHSGFRDAFARAFGEAPGRARGRDGIVFDWISSPVGPLVIAATGAGIVLLEFGDPAHLTRQIERLRAVHDAPAAPGRNAHLDRLERELEEYFAGRRREFATPLVQRGTPFQERVWRALLEVPYGETRSYLDVARAIRAPGAMRAVGTANGSNRIAIAIPCHRIVNADGRLGGYGGGLHRKRFLLELERTTLAGG